MAKQAGLTPITVRNAKAGTLSDGGGLMLVTKASGARSWVLRVQADGKRRDYGLGASPAVSLAQAREKAAMLRRQVKEGADPLEAKREAKAGRIEAATRTFETVARKMHGDLAPGFKNVKHAAQWLSTLEAVAFPAFGSKPVAAITGPMILDALEPIWTRTPETARRTRQRIAAVLDYAHARGWRERSPDVKVLAAKGLAPQTDRKEHHPAVDYADAPAVLAKLRAAPETVGRLGLLFTIYTAARSGETRGATWGEVDLDAGLWTIPGARMKAGKDHTVPLTAPALAVLERAKAGRLTDSLTALIFPGANAGKPMSDMTMGKAQQVLAPGTTVHGWRSTFRDWAGETTAFGSDVCEAALAHTVGNKVQRAYQRGTMLDKRRELMSAWAVFLAPTATGTGVVVLASRRAERAA